MASVVEDWRSWSDDTRSERPREGQRCYHQQEEMTVRKGW
jgi:hypothetical protein